jgi:osmotically-inducible protein OsmY
MPDPAHSSIPARRDKRHLHHPLLRNTNQLKQTAMTNTTDRTDTEIKNDVLSELKYEPSVKITDIGVLVKDGTVTLNGFATSYGEKWNAVKSAKRVGGVRAIADDIEIKLPESMKRNDGDIATAVANHIELAWAGPTKMIQVTVREGWITLEGEVEWRYQRDAAENAVRYLSGVKGVANAITIKSKVTSALVETAIKEAFRRNALVDADNIEVVTSGNKVILRGKVRNYAELEEAERVAWAAPGVRSVDNHLKVEWSWRFTS